MQVTEVGEIWRCDVCGNVVEVKTVGGGELLCCGGPMTKVGGRGAGASSEGPCDARDGSSPASSR